MRGGGVPQILNNLEVGNFLCLFLMFDITEREVLDPSLPPFRRGKWTTEEENYALRLITELQNGISKACIHLRPQRCSPAPPREKVDRSHPFRWERASAPSGP
jgi:hypothetical protein